MSPSLQARYEWNQLNWKKVQVKVFKLQRRIYRASQQGNVKLVHRLQRLFIKSWYGRLLAVRRVTQDNQGKRTAGVDGIKSLSPSQRLHLAQSLSQTPQAQPLRRIWIPKPGKSQKRPLSIPVMADRAAQALIKLALEPEWEAKLEPNTYGFRPGRSCHDAIAAIFNIIRLRPKYVLEGDISGCFENISHSDLLEKTQAPPSIRRLLVGWLKCGVLDSGFQPTERGTPQGGVASPLLALIALQGLETHLKSLGTQRQPIHVVFYADDFVVFANQLSDIQRAKAAVERWLQGIGLQLHPEKTKISHTLSGDAGFDFLGFSVRQYPAGKYASKHGFKTLIKPSQSSQKQHLAQLKKIVSSHSSTPQAGLIAQLHPVITGWCRYYSTVVSKEVFTSINSHLFGQLLRWAKHRHPKHNNHRIVSRYWLVNQGEGWVFQSPDGLKLCHHNEMPIRRHTKVKANRSPYDGDWVYWGMRLKSYPELPPLWADLLKRQRGQCAYCGLNFLPSDLIELHHQDGNHSNHRRQNLALLHRHCHDQVHAVRTTTTTGITETNQVGEEPDAPNGARPVLKPSR
jgi:RNA-directed DNA polymerase